jgi:hypothetical protein
VRRRQLRRIGRRSLRRLQCRRNQRGPRERSRGGSHGIRPRRSGKDREKGSEVGGGGGLIERHADRGLAELPQVDALRRGSGHEIGGARDGAAGQLHPQGVEEGLRGQLVTEAPEAAGQRLGQDVHALGDGAQPVGTVVHRVHSGHDGEQRLGRADVARRFLAADVLLASLHRHPVGRLTVSVARDTDDAPRDLALELFAGGQERCMGAAEAERHAEALRRSHRNVGPHLARRAQEGQGEEIGSHDHQGAGGVGGGDEGREVEDAAVGGRILEQNAEHIVADRGLGGRSASRRRRRAVQRQDAHYDADGFGAGAQHGQGLRVTARGHQKHVALARLAVRCESDAHVHGLRGGGRFIEQRGVGDRQAGEVGHHRLEVEQSLQTALGDLRLVRGVLRVPTGILQDIALDHSGHDAVVVAHPKVGLEDLVARRQTAQHGKNLALTQLAVVGQAGQRERPAEADGLGDGLAHQLFERVEPEGMQHLAHLGLLGTEVPSHEGVGGLKSGLRSLEVQLRARGGLAAGGPGERAGSVQGGDRSLRAVARLRHS